MATLNNLLDKAKQTCNAHTDMALAEKLKVSRQRVSNWRHGTNYPDPVACARLAEMTGEPLARVLGMVGEARAISQDEKRVWRRLANAAAIAVAALLPLSTPATASHGNGLNDAPNMHYAKTRRRSLLDRAIFAVRKIWNSVTIRALSIEQHHAPAPSTMLAS